MNSIEEDIEVLESIVKVNNDFLRGIENQTINQKEITALQHILSDYKKLQEEFKQVDHECDRLEKIDFEKDMKIKELQRENEELKNNTIRNENELEVGIDCDWDALKKALDEAKKTNEYIIYDNEKWIKEKYCVPIQKVKDLIKEKEWATESYDCAEADYKQSQAIGAWCACQKLLKGEE